MTWVEMDGRRPEGRGRVVERWAEERRRRKEGGEAEGEKEEAKGRKKVWRYGYDKWALA